MSLGIFFFEKFLNLAYYEKDTTVTRLEQNGACRALYNFCPFDSCLCHF